MQRSSQTTTQSSPQGDDDNPQPGSKPILTGPGGLKLSPEQLQIINHPDGCHGKVLSVAGSGKTTTMACRIKELIENRGIRPSQIQVLMYNRLARQQFHEKLDQIGIPAGQHPAVDTFHSYAYHLIENKEKRQDWAARGDQATIALRQSLQKVVSERFPPEPSSTWQEQQDRLQNIVSALIGPSQEAIMLWKNAAIRPEYAGYDASEALAEVFQETYREFERRRNNANQALTYDDFVLEALDALEDPETMRRRASHLKHIIVDEYQDINLGQQLLLERLASFGADLMAVGDDDQTIYEWRGARADYILGEFQNTFDGKPHRTYKLTRSFRFGYHIAQTAQNLIRHNPNRLSKDLLAYRPQAPSKVQLCGESEAAGSGNGANANDANNANNANIANSNPTNRDSSELLVDALEQLLNQGDANYNAENTDNGPERPRQSRQTVKADQIRILGRSHAQLNGCAAELLRRKIPFQTVDHSPFLETAESQTLLDYLQLAAYASDTRHFAVPQQTPDPLQLLRSCANRPNRYLSQQDQQGIVDTAARQGTNLLQAMRKIAAPDGKPGTSAKLQNLDRLADLLERTARELGDPGAAQPVGPILSRLCKSAGLEEHYLTQHGPGDAAQQRLSSLDQTMDYAQRSRLSWLEFLEHVRQLDYSQGEKEANRVKLMTINATKGLEFDYVFLPDCSEGKLPSLHSGSDPTYDRRQPRRAPQPAEWLENERRLCYVGITRARRAVFLGAPDRNGRETPPKPSRFIEELELDILTDLAPEVRKVAQRTSPGARLLTMLEARRDHHDLIRVIRAHYAPDFPQELREKVDQIRPSAAERPFGYKLQYDRPRRPLRQDRHSTLNRQIQELLTASLTDSIRQTDL